MTPHRVPVRRGALAALLLVTALAAAACGGSSSSGSASTTSSTSTTTTTAGAAAATGATSADMAKYTACLTKHGVTLPTGGGGAPPGGAGGTPPAAPTGTTGMTSTTARPAMPRGGNATFAKAQTACASLRPAGMRFGGGPGGGTQADSAAFAAYSNCLKLHGVSASATRTTAGTAPTAAQKKAETACASLRPTRKALAAAGASSGNS